jgi:hypothetical protein
VFADTEKQLSMPHCCSNKIRLMLCGDVYIVLILGPVYRATKGWAAGPNLETVYELQKFGVQPYRIRRVTTISA